MTEPDTQQRAEPQPLDDRELAAWRAYVETVGDLSYALDADLQHVGLTVGDYQVLVFLSESEDRAMRMCDLATMLHISASGLTRRLDGLVRLGLVTREPSATDRRVMLAVLTADGAAKLEEAYPAHLASVRRHVIDRLPRRDVDALGRVFAAIQSGLREDKA